MFHKYPYINTGLFCSQMTTITTIIISINLFIVILFSVFNFTFIIIVLIMTDISGWNYCESEINMNHVSFNRYVDHVETIST